MNLKSAFLLPVAFLIVLGAGCAKEKPLAVPLPVPARVVLEQSEALQTGDATLRFKLYGENGQELQPADLKTVHEKLLHLILVRDDRTQFQHLHPEYATGTWAVTTNIPEQGDYLAYADFAPKQGSPEVIRVPVRIGGATLAKTFPVPTANLTVQTGDIQTKLSTQGALKAREMTRLTFSLTRKEIPVKDISPYLGAFGHVVLLRHSEPNDFIHVHPTTERPPTDGSVVFMTAFPTEGRYTLYAQFNVGGSVKTFPITIDVAKNGNDSPMVGHDSHMGHE